MGNICAAAAWARSLLPPGFERQTVTGDGNGERDQNRWTGISFAAITVVAHTFGRVADCRRFVGIFAGGRVLDAATWSAHSVG